MALTRGMNHLGLAVRDLEQTTRFFTQLLGWTESGRDPGYPRTSVTDGVVRLTLWQVDHTLDVQPFDRRRNVGLHHLALEVESRARLDEVHALLRAAEGVTVEFGPEPLGAGPRMHLMCREPGGLRLEFIWPGT